MIRVARADLLKRLAYLFAPGDHSVAQELYARSRTGLIYLGIACALAYGYGVVSEFYFRNWLNFWLTAGQAICSISLIVLGLVSLGTGATRIWSVGLFLVLTLLEIETQFHDSWGSKFTDPAMWLSIMALMGVNAFLHYGQPWQYAIIWAIVFSAYCLRIYLPDHRFPDRALQPIGTIAALVVFWGFLNAWWYRTRYRLIDYERKLTDAQTKLVKLEREAILSNLHDIVGSDITDLVLMLEGFNGSTSPNVDKALTLARRSLTGLRASIHERDDWAILDEHFFRGLKVILHRRYESVQRSAILHSDSAEEWHALGCLSEDQKRELYAVFMELCTNDLKYGGGRSQWNIVCGEKSLEVSLSSEVGVALEQKFSGRGIESARRRLERMDGTIEHERSLDRYVTRVAVTYAQQ